MSATPVTQFAAFMAVRSVKNTCIGVRYTQATNGSAFPLYAKECAMTDPASPSTDGSSALWVAAGEDRFGDHRGLGVSTIAFKVVPHDWADLLIVENTFHANGGPARHLHYEQDEWFYVLEGDFLIEVGNERRMLQAGDSLLAPRQVPHVWAFVGAARGRILITFHPAGQMEAFFREVTKANAMPPQDPALWRAHGMELLGPPLAVT
jgi:quercetin dioxygenase-like cupin family protein